SFGYRSNPRYAIKECSSCGTLYTIDCVCSMGTVEDKILVPNPLKTVHGVQDFQNSSKPSNASTNVVNAPREPYDAHIGYNCPSKISVISNLEPCNNQTINELPQTLPIFHPAFQSEAESPFTLDSTPTYVDESPNVFNPHPQSPVYPCEFYGNDAC
nr:hypothetical protein [Tanacetum cinerariifolium]